jgi:hypothetical protein
MSKPQTTEKTGFIDINWTWRSTLAVCLAVFENPATAEGKRKSREELERMADAADLSVKMHETLLQTVKTIESHYVDGVPEWVRLIAQRSLESIKGIEK